MPHEWIRRVLCALLALPLAAFFGFVGWHKAFAPLTELAQHNAFTVHLPVLLGKVFGWLEMAGALALVAGLVLTAARRWQILFALWLVFEQVISSIIHLQHGEQAMLPQNGLLVVMLLAVALLARIQGSKADA